MLEKNRIYEYKGKQYSIVGNAITLDETSGFEDKIESIVYCAIKPDGKIDMSEKFIRSRQDFIEKFIPISLWVGDEVAGISMGKIIEVLKIIEVKDTIAKCEKENLTFSKVISANGSVKLISKNDNATIDYYFVDEASKRKLIRKREISPLIRRIKTAVEKLDDDNYQNFSTQGLASKVLDIENFVISAHCRKTLCQNDTEK